MTDDFDEDDECECGTMESTEWIKLQTEYLKKIKKFKLKEGDRLHSVAELSYMHKILSETVLSWSNWVNGWVSIELGKKISVEEGDEIVLSNDELKELHKNYQDITAKFLEMDLKLTESFTKKMQEKQANIAKACAAIKIENKSMVV